MAAASLTISSRNYSSWSLRGWLACRLSGLDFDVEMLRADDTTIRAELLHLSPSFLVPKLVHDGLVIWDVLAIAEYLDDLMPRAGLLPEQRGDRARCRSVSAEMHGGFVNLRTALPMNLRARHSNFAIFSGARGDIDRICAIFADCLTVSDGPFLFGKRPCLADAMFAPVCTRFRTYDVSLPGAAQAYCETILAWDLMREWISLAMTELEEIDELDVEF